MRNILFACTLPIFFLVGCAEWQAKSKAKEEVAEIFIDPDSVKFTKIKAKEYGSSYMVCGEVNAKNKMGAYTGPKPFVKIGRTEPIVLGVKTLSDKISGNIDSYNKSQDKLMRFYSTCQYSEKKGLDYNVGDVDKKWNLSYDDDLSFRLLGNNSKENSLFFICNKSKFTGGISLKIPALKEESNVEYKIIIDNQEYLARKDKKDSRFYHFIEMKETDSLKGKKLLEIEVKYHNNKKTKESFNISKPDEVISMLKSCVI